MAYNLKKTEDLGKVQNFALRTSGTGRFNEGMIHRYIKTGERDIYYNKNTFFLYDYLEEYHENFHYIVENGIFYSHEDGFDPYKDVKRTLRTATCNSPQAIQLSERLPGVSDKCAVSLLLNGDGDGYYNLTHLNKDHDYNFPTFSFHCLGRFYHSDEMKGIKMMLKAIQSGDLSVVHYTSDHYLPASKAVNKRGWVKNKPPKPGYTRLHDSWHRPATVLFHDKKTDSKLLLGQDEGTYFGCELSGNPNTVEDAYEDLIPPQIRQLPNLLRQGEWFLVPVKDKDVPSIVDAPVTFEEFSLPVESLESRFHNVSCKSGLMDKNGRLYAKNPYVEHDDHQSISEEGWFFFIRNTAKRSFSVDGVD